MANPRIKLTLFGAPKFKRTVIRRSSLVSIGTREQVRSPYAVKYAVASKRLMRIRWNGEKHKDINTIAKTSTIL